MNTRKIYSVARMIVSAALGLLLTGCFAGVGGYYGSHYDRYARYPPDRFYFGYPHYRYAPHPFDRYGWKYHRGYPYRDYPFRYGPGFRGHEPDPFRYKRDYFFGPPGRHPFDRSYFHPGPGRPHRRLRR